MPAPTPSQDVAVAIEPDYSPSVGDEVSFESYMSATKGIVFKATGVGGLLIACNNGEWAYQRELSSIKKTGVHFLNTCQISDAQDLAKAYFKAKEQVGFKADPALSYAENQAAWVEFYKLEAGSKVKVVKEFKTDKNGCHAGWNKGKSRCIGEVYSIAIIDTKRIVIKTDVDSATLWPYFALEPA
jgi:hypothetical protein